MESKVEKLDSPPDLEIQPIPVSERDVELTSLLQQIREAVMGATRIDFNAFKDTVEVSQGREVTESYAIQKWRDFSDNPIGYIAHRDTPEALNLLDKCLEEEG
jgi:hypothetical protein